MSLDLANNELPSLPPWLEHGTRLTALILCANQGLRADAEPLLSLPALRHLDIRDTDVDSEVARHICCAAPEHLRVVWGYSDGSGSGYEEGYGGAYASDSSDSSDGCPRLDFGGCAYGARWY